MRFSLFVLAVVICRALAQDVQAGEWPQILGPNRDGQAIDEHLADNWPKDGPALLWQYDVGSGYAGVAVARGRVLLFHRREDEAIIEALDARTGKPIWKNSFPTHYRNGIAPDDGPLCVPLMHEESVYLVGAEGDLHRVRFDSGKEVWSRDAYGDYEARLSYFGAGSTPIVVGDKLFMNVGGRDAGIVAFALSDGKTVWKATKEDASYSSPIAATLDGKQQIVFLTRLNLVGVDPATGATQFRFPFGMLGPTVNAATPRMVDDAIFVSANYGIGARLLKIVDGNPETIWDRDDIMSSQFTTCVEHKGTLFGIDGRQDVGLARLRAFNPKTPEVYWTQEGFGAGTLLLADDKLLVMKVNGELVLAEPSAKEYRPLQSAKIFDTIVQALPALSEGRLYVRETRRLKCLDVGRSERKP